jgi:hypothetical protein
VHLVPLAESIGTSLANLTTNRQAESATQPAPEAKPACSRLHAAKQLFRLIVTGKTSPSIP